jgi:hypothetical protein
MFGQIWLAQFAATGGLANRPVLGNATASSAFTAGAKPGSAITDAPNNANTASAEMDLIILSC